MDTGKRMKERRKELGLKAEDVALEIGCSRSTIFRYENGDIEKVPAAMLEPIAKVLNTTPAYLMGWTDFPYDLDNDPEFYFPSEYQKIGMAPEDYFCFKQAEFEDGMKESLSAPAPNTYCTEHETKVLDAYRERTEMQPVIDKLLDIEPEEPAHLMPVAAHNDNPDEGQQELMRKDLDKF